MKHREPWEAFEVSSPDPVRDSIAALLTPGPAPEPVRYVHPGQTYMPDLTAAPEPRKSTLVMSVGDSVVVLQPAAPEPSADGKWSPLDPPDSEIFPPPPIDPVTAAERGERVRLHTVTPPGYEPPKYRTHGRAPEVHLLPADLRDLPACIQTILALEIQINGRILSRLPRTE